MAGLVPGQRPGDAVQFGLIVREVRERDAGQQIVDPLAGISLADLTDRKSTRLNSSHSQISYAVFCLKKKKNMTPTGMPNLLLRSKDIEMYHSPYQHLTHTATSRQSL